jgi:hypothetical protein
VSFPRTFGEAWDWLRGRDPLPPPNPERTAEAAWVPTWQGQMLTDELVASGIPAVVVEDFGINLSMYSREPMSRIFVTEDRKAEAEALVEEILGHAPRHRGL